MGKRLLQATKAYDFIIYFSYSVTADLNNTLTGIVSFLSLTTVLNLATAFSMYNSRHPDTFHFYSQVFKVNS